MREWLSGGVSPCQGEGRGFESRLALFLLPGIMPGFFVPGKHAVDKSANDFSGCKVPWEYIPADK